MINKDYFCFKLFAHPTPQKQVNLTATLGTFDVAATVDRVSIKGEGEKDMTLSSPLLSALNRQLQFVTYTNIVFHPKTADPSKVIMQILSSY